MNDHSHGWSNASRPIPSANTESIMLEGGTHAGEWLANRDGPDRLSFQPKDRGPAEREVYEATDELTSDGLRIFRLVP